MSTTTSVTQITHMDNADKLSKLTIILHWLVAIAMIALTAIGLYMSKTETWALYPIHKSFGVLVFFIIMLRVFWRIRNGWPEAAGDYSRLEHVLAKLVHWVLIVATIAMPVSGMIHSGASGHGFGIFGLTIVPGNHVAGDPDNVIPYHAGLAETGEFLHEAIGYILIAAIILHIVGALKHHVLDRDATLLRMLGKSAPGK